MGIGGCIVVFALGAIMVFASDWHLHGVNVHVVGWILMVAGVLGLVTYISVFRRRMVRRVGVGETVEERRYYDEP